MESNDLSRACLNGMVVTCLGDVWFRVQGVYPLKFRVDTSSRYPTSMPGHLHIYTGKDFRTTNPKGGEYIVYTSGPKRFPYELIALNYPYISLLYNPLYSPSKEIRLQLI